MWKLVGVGAVAASLLSGCYIDLDDEGDGFKVTESRALDGFTRVENRTSMKVVVREAPRSDVKVTLDRNLQDELETWVTGDTLIIDTGGPLSFSGDGTVEVSLPRFLGAKLDSSGELSVEGLTHVEDVLLVSSGSGRLRFCGPAHTLVAEGSGSGGVTLCTPTEQLVEQVKVTLSGSGSVEWTGMAREVDVSSEGSGRVVLSGDANHLQARVAGSGNVDAQELRASSADLHSESSGDMLARVDGGGVNVTIDSSGDVELWGSASLQTVRVRGSGELVRH